MTSGRPQMAVVTGAARGIGHTIAMRLAARSIAVAILDKDQTDAERAAAMLPAGLGRGYGCDVTDLAQVERVIAEIGHAGGCSMLVCNHGWTPNKPFADTDADERRAIVEVNYLGALNVCAAALGQLTAADHGRIVLVSSDAARIGTPKEAVYAGAKAALIAFGKSLAIELARDDVTVNIVCPGSTDTPLIRTQLSEEQIEKRIRANPMRRLGRPDDVAAAVEYFLSEEAEFVTGQVLSVNGGMTRVD